MRNQAPVVRLGHIEVTEQRSLQVITIAFILLLAVGLPGLWLVAHKKGVADAED